MALQMSRARVAAAVLSLAAGAFPGPLARAADVPFGSRQPIPTSADGPEGIATADFDGDGDLDLLSAWINTGDSVAWYENDGSGSFGTEHVISTLVNGPRRVAAADLDGDGDLDALSASSGDSKIAWYENRLDEVSADWAPQVVISTDGAGAVAVTAADLDGDGDLDVLAGSVSDSEIAWYENTDGAGAFGSQQIISTLAAAPRTLVAADLDGDGDLDVLSASDTDNEIAWYENRLDEVSADWAPQVVISSTALGAFSVAAADFDRDGDLDVLSASFSDDTIAWYENTDGAGSFGPKQVISTLADGARTVVAADLDQDGDLDALSASELDNEIALYENRLDEPNADFVERILSSAGNRVWGLVVGDLDRDGDPDLASTSFDDDTIATHENQSIHRSAQFPTAEVVTDAISGAERMTSGDVDGDGDLDLLGGNSGDQVLRWYSNDAGDGSSWTETQIGSGDAERSLLRDVDRDGDLDVLGAGLSGAGVSWYENTAGDGSAWTLHAIRGENANELAAADLDADGDLDLVVAHTNVSPDLVAWYENLGTSFSAVQNVVANVSDGVGSLVTADFDGDGDTDVAVPWTNPDALIWYANDGGGSGWAATTIPLGGLEVDFVLSADLDGDGDPDVASLSGGDNDLVWYENQGAGASWAAPVVVGAASGSSSDLAAGDVDGDGDVDLAGSALASVSWWENSGDGSGWTEHPVAFDNEGSFAIHLADLDSDGALDLINSQAALDRIRWYRNRGGQFALPTEDVSRQGAALEGTEEALLRIDAAHRGRSGDSDVQFVDLQLDAEEAEGDPLTDAEANALVEELRVYLDDGSGVFEAKSDTLIFTLATLSVSGGRLRLEVDTDPDFLLTHGTPRSWFVVALFTANAASQTPNTLRLSHGTFESSGADAASSIRATLEFLEVATASLQVLDPAADEDADGLSNQVELDAEGTDPFDADSDSDGVSDGDEVNTHLSDPLDADSDGDGWTDGAEVALGSDPTSAGSIPAYTGLTPFTEMPPVASPFAANEVIPFDVDRDGDADLIATSGAPDNETVWFENTAGDGSSWTEQPIAAGAAPDGVAADFDRDGDVDVATASFFNAILAWTENQGGGVWNKVTIEGAGLTSLQDIDRGDVDGDGDLDLVLSNKAGNLIAWYENDGGGPPTFTRRVVTRQAEAVTAVSSFDLDRDGDLDLLSISDDGTGQGLPGETTLLWHENSAGDGTLWVPHTVSTDSDGRDLQAADVDGDGDPDLVAGGALGLVWFENEAGDATAWDEHAVVQSTTIQEVHVRDVDLDGDVDIVVGGTGSAPLSWYENVNGDGSVWAPQSLGAASTSSFGVAAADLDGDGDLDVASGDASSDALRWLRNDTIHRSARFEPFGVYTGAPEVVRMARLADLDGDGDLDVAAIFAGPDTVAWFENDGTGALGPLQVIATLTDPAGIEAGDIDRDGDIDLAVSGAGMDLVWYANDGSAGFGPATAIDTTESGLLSLSDLDGDGDPDLVIARFFAFDVSWYANDGSGGFGARQLVGTTTSHTNQARAGDLDGDGDLDVAAVTGASLVWFQGDGQGGFGPLQLIRTHNTARGVELADFDGDGDLDVAGAWIDGHVSWFANDGAGGFGAETALATDQEGAQALVAGDFDRDGDIDLQALSGQGSATGVFFYENLGGGSFAPGERAPVALFGGWVDAGDLDGDGDLDVLVPIATVENRLAQLELPPTDVAYAGMIDSQRRQVLEVLATHAGRAGDSDEVITSVQLLLSDGLGTPLTDPEADALLTTIELRRGTESGTLMAFGSPGLDTNGVHTIAVAANGEVTQGAPVLFTVVVTLSATASSASPNAFEIELLTRDASTAEDASAGLPVTIQLEEEASTGVITALSAAGDADGDGLSNGDEANVHLTDPGNSDTDGDGLTDGDEVNVHLTDPLDPDSDGDGLDDGTEIAIATDPNDPDHDNDGELDGADNCPAVSNPGQENSDGFAAGDACQCGDVTGEGVVNAADATRAREFLVDRTLGGAFDETRCDVTGDQLCGVDDVAVLRRLAAGQPATLQDRCDAYLGP